MDCGYDDQDPIGFIAIWINVDQNCYDSLGKLDHHVKHLIGLKGEINFLV